ncbi:MAG: PD-(D/E)XK nuclease family protein [Verrucomicrobia bacterium]|nr:PD-(D/E)XK nuclease family protein [Verrucomicrobiota bacterium]MDA1086996.1 PD-(D/E)XK nuclease family protein [Verrucomicrobiota bacterium]
MAELKNTFSWSFSAHEDFDECRRRRYWSKYGKWGGWDARASEIQRKAYMLDKMDNRYSIQGNAVESSVMWVLREKQAGRDVSVEDAYEQVARPFLNKCWKESKGKAWQRDAKHHCNLREHYYPEQYSQDEREWTPVVIENTRRCIANFIERVLPGLSHITADHEVEIAQPGGGGDPEHFIIEDVKIYAIPDYVYRDQGVFHIIDWKSGRPRPSHRNQVGLYGLWAHLKHEVPAEEIIVTLHYLSEGTAVIEPLSDDRLLDVQSLVGESVGDMSGYLVAEDRGANKPLPREEWDLAPSRQPCRVCNFYELCEPEFGADTD